MAGIRIEGNTSGQVAEVDSSNQLKVTTTQVEANLGGTFVDMLIDDGALNNGTRVLKSPWVSDDHRLSVGADVPIFSCVFNAASQDTGVWKYTATTMAATQAGGFLNLNSGGTLTTATGVSMQSWATMPMLNGAVLLKMTANFTQPALANQIVEYGLFQATTTTQPVEGVWFQYTNAGLIGVLNYNGAIVTTGVMSGTVGTNANHVFEILVEPGDVEFWFDDKLVGVINTPAGNGYPFMTQAMPVALQFRNSGAVSGTPMQARFAEIEVDIVDTQLNPPAQTLLPLVSGMGSQGTSGGTMGTTALYTNSLAAGAGVAMTNTTAAPGSGLGGQFAVQPTLAVGTDGILASFQVPVGGINQTPKRLVINGVRIQGGVTTSITGGPVMYAYSLAYGHTAVSMATAEGTSFTTSPTTKAPRRIPLGFESYPANIASGTIGQGVYVPLNNAVVVNPGEFVAITAKNMGVVTSAGVINVLVTFDCSWL